MVLFPLNGPPRLRYFFAGMCGQCIESGARYKLASTFVRGRIQKKRKKRKAEWRENEEKREKRERERRRNKILQTSPYRMLLFEKYLFTRGRNISSRIGRHRSLSVRTGLKVCGLETFATCSTEWKSSLVKTPGRRRIFGGEQKDIWTQPHT